MIRRSATIGLSQAQHGLTMRSNTKMFERGIIFLFMKGFDRNK